MKKVHIWGYDTGESQFNKSLYIYIAQQERVYTTISLTLKAPITTIVVCFVFCRLL